MNVIDLKIYQNNVFDNTKEWKSLVINLRKSSLLFPPDHGEH